jgi:hypothetical protein
MVVVRGSVRGYQTLEPVTSTLFAPADLLVPPGETSGKIRMKAESAVTWEIRPGSAPIPDSGTVVRLVRSMDRRASDPPAEGVVRDSRLVVHGFGPGVRRAVAIAPDGSRAELFAPRGSDRGGAITFEAARSVTLQLHDDQSRPLAGESLYLRGPFGRPVTPILRTDEAGTVSIERVHVPSVEVRWICDPRYPHWNRAVGRATLQPGATKVEIEVPSPRKIRLELSCDGESMRPGEYWVMTGSTLARGYEETGDAGVVVEIVPETDGDALELRIFATDFLDQTVTVNAPPGSTENVAIALERGTRLIADVASPEDNRGRVTLEVRDPRRDTWSTYVPPPTVPPRSPVHPLIRSPQRFGPLPPGRYRLVEPSSGIVSEEFEAKLTRREVRLVLDLSQVATLTGTVTLPEGFDSDHAGLENTTLRVKGEQGQARTVPVSVDGSFRCRVDWSHPVMLTPEHPDFSGEISIVTERTATTSVRLLAPQR